MDISLKEVASTSRYVLENLFSYYVYDMSDFLQLDPQENGQFRFKSASLDIYWQRSDHVAYFIYADSSLAGFVLVRKYPGDPLTYDVEQFFVLRKYKGKGVGKHAFAMVTDLHKGLWQIRVLKENHAALKFWKSSVSNLVGADFELSKDIDIDLEMHFLRFEVAS